MAVTMSAGGYMRSDFMISDAALPIRMEEFQQEQAMEFAKVLEGFDDAAAGSGAITVKKTADAGASEIGNASLDGARSGSMTFSKVSTEEIEPIGSLGLGEVRFEDCDEQTQQALLAASLPDDPQELMRMVLSGKIRLSDIPEDKMSPEFLMLLALIRRTNPELLEQLEGKESNKPGEQDSEETAKESDFDYEKLLKEALANQDQLMAMLLNVPVDKTDEMGAITTDPKKMVEEIISFDKSETPVMSWSAHINTEMMAEKAAEAEETEVTELLSRLTDNVEEGFDKSAFGKIPEKGNVPVESGIIRSTRLDSLGKVELPVVKAQPIGNKVPVVAEKPVVPKAPAQVQSVGVKPADVSDIVNTAAEIGTAEINVTTTNKQTNIISDTTQAVKEFTAADAQSLVISAAEPVANTVNAGMEYESNASGKGQTRSDSGMTFVRQTADTDKAEAFVNRTADSGAVVDAKAVAFEMKQSPVKGSERNEASDFTPETTVPTEKTARPEVKPLIQSRVKSAADELEILKNAKSKVETAGNEVPQHTENPLVSDEPIVFFRDGERIEVRPGEILSQAAEKLIETARDMPKGETEYSLELNPEELGKITVKLTKAASGEVSVTIAAENARTRRVLEENSGIMQDNLRNNGVRLESWQTVNESDHENRAQDYNGSAKNPYHHENSRKNGEEENDSTFAELIASM